MRLAVKIGFALVVLLGLVESVMLMALVWPVPGLRAVVWSYWRPLHWLMLGVAGFVGLVLLSWWLALWYRQPRR